VAVNGTEQIIKAMKSPARILVGLVKERNITSELTGRGDYIQPST
ncbi:MAG: hypothetical protein QOJ58_4286, partial [Alphaproteobacteria bacterium]|nr:hypothetical protein [Alphaproteobacteria bacterium]